MLLKENILNNLVSLLPLLYEKGEWLSISVTPFTKTYRERSSRRSLPGESLNKTKPRELRLPGEKNERR